MDRSGRAFSAVSAFACGIGSFVVALASVQCSVDALQIETPALRLDTLGEFQQTLDGLGRVSSEPEGLDVLLFGDSSMYSPEDGGAFGAGLARQLESRGTATEVRTHRLAAPGLDAFSFFFTASHASREAPEMAIVAFNLNSLSRGWGRHFGIPALAALVPADAIARTAILPTDRIGLSVDQMLTYRMVLHSVGFEFWRRVRALQARVHEARRIVERRFGSGSEYATRLRTIDTRNRRHRAPPDRRGRPRTSAFGYRERYAGALRGATTGHPTLRALRATLERLQGAQIPTLVYATPQNVEHMRSVGIGEDAAFEAAIALVERISVENGAYFVDLHAAFPDADFRDEGDHLEFEGPRSGLARLTARLARHVDQILRSIGSSDRGAETDRFVSPADTEGGTL